MKNDILLNIEEQKVTLLVLLDLSAAFDTVRHDILVDRLRSRLDVTDKALNWFTPYLSDSTQRVAVNGGLSDTFPHAQGAPQGSCVGPLLFTVYTSELFDIVNEHLRGVHSYADDTQLYLALRTCRKWMIRDRLLLNDDKTEFLLLGTKQQLAKVDINSITLGESVVNTKPVVRNLGSWFDSQLSMSTHIRKLCSSAFFHLHNISRIRKFLSPVETKYVVHEFVTSRVNYCNSLLCGLPASQLNKFQRVLNTAARLVCCAPRFSHITPLIYELHWLPLKQRIHFKILFAFKAIYSITPTYIQNLVSLKSQGT